MRPRYAGSHAPLSRDAPADVRILSPLRPEIGHILGSPIRSDHQLVAHAVHRDQVDRVRRVVLELSPE